MSRGKHKKKTKKKTIVFQATRADSYRVMCTSAGKARYEQFGFSLQRHCPLFATVPFGSHNKRIKYIAGSYYNTQYQWNILTKVNCQLTVKLANFHDPPFSAV